MKPIRAISVLLLCLACITIATASTAPLPSQKEVTDFLDGCKSTSASDIFDSVKTNHPTWTADLWTAGNQEAISLYYADSASATGHRSIYFIDGNMVSSSSLKGYTLKEKYVGKVGDTDKTTDTKSTASSDESVSSDEKITDEKTTGDSASKIIQEGDDSKNTYTDFTKFLDNYKGSFDYSEENIQNLNDIFNNDGWDSEIKYCVAVNTSDEGVYYVVLEGDNTESEGGDTESDNAMISTSDTVVTVTSLDQISTALAKGPVFVKLGTKTCGACQSMESILEELASKYAGKVTVMSVDIDESPAIADSFGVTGVPASFLIKNVSGNYGFVKSDGSTTTTASEAKMGLNDVSYFENIIDGIIN